jgi:hypothetical protein
VSRELRNGDLVRVPVENIASSYEGWTPDGLLGIVIDDIDADDEVHIMYTGSMLTGWWNVESLELVSDGGGVARVRCSDTGVAGPCVHAKCKTSPVVV